MLIEDRSKLVMIGDSITDCGRERPVGEGQFGQLGTGYVSLVSALLQAAEPETKIRVVNMGIGGNRVRDLAGRWDTDVVQLKPDWLSILIGINDVWRQFDAPGIIEKHVYLDEYSETLEKLVKTTLPELKGMVLMAPFIMEPNKQDPMRAQMDKYGEVVKGLAKRYNTLFVDTQAVFDNYLKHYYSAAISKDRIHPNATGHMVIARAFLEAVGFRY